MATVDRKTYNQRIREDQKVRGFRRVNVTLSPTELARLEASAAQSRSRVTTHLKACALAYLDGKYLVPPDLADRLDDLLRVIRGIGNNLNQLARHSNEMRYFLDTEEVRLNLRRMDEEIKRFVASPVLVKEEGEQGKPP